MLTLAEANQAIAAALGRAQNMKKKIAVSVCDEGGRLVAFQRMDGVFSESIALAIGKAIGAAASIRSDGNKDDVSVIRNAQTVGAIGVSGSVTDQEDEQFAKAGVEALARSS
jgi:uncharacterized protein GlcG (DUF336 family)